MKNRNFGSAMHWIAAVHLLAALGMAQNAHAEKVGDLAKMQSEAIFAKAQANLAAARGTHPAAQPGNLPRTEPRDAEVPVVRGVYGIGSRLIALFAYADGSTIEVEPGGQVAGYTVAEISLDRVLLSKGKKKIFAPLTGRSIAGTEGVRIPERLNAANAGFLPPPPVGMPMPRNTIKN